MIPITEIDKEAYLDSIARDARALADAARPNLDLPVPSCPGWDMAMLVAHTGGVHRAWAYVVRERLQEEPSGFPEEVFGELRPWMGQTFFGEGSGIPRPEGLVAWFEGGAALLLDALRGADLDEPIQHWSGDNRAVSHLRMMRFETAIHRWDAEAAGGAPGVIDRDTAIAGIEQTFDVMLPARRRWQEPAPGGGESFHFHTTDGPGEWLVIFAPDGPEVRREHARADVAVRGTAEELFLFLWGRLPGSRLEVLGDASLLDRWTTLVPPM
jgi:uncharacterized protein (TIGR03083 family)